MDAHASKNFQLDSIKLPAGGPYNSGVEEPKLNGNAVSVGGKFEVSCHAGVVGHLEAVSDSASIRIGQRVCNKGKDEYWSSLLVECREHDDGSLAVEVVVYHPDWDEPVRIACIQSNAACANGAGPSVRCDLEHKQL